MRLKRNFLACALLVVILAVIANTTLAYYTDAVETHNVITSGGIGVSLVEKDGDGEPWTTVENVMPGDVVDKIVTVTNEEQPAWVRVWVDVEAVVFIDENEDTRHFDISRDFLATGDAPADGPQRTDPVSIDFNAADWTYNESDGHFYYKSELGTGETTEPLFTKVVFNAEDMGNDWQNGKLVISVTAEAVQVANNPDAAGFACPTALDEKDAHIVQTGKDGPGGPEGGPGADVDVPGDQGSEDEIVSPGGDALPTG